ncbi:MAG: TRAP transporter substrate-binding protein [Acetobacterales bacterium]
MKKTYRLAAATAAAFALGLTFGGSASAQDIMTKNFKVIGPPTNAPNYRASFLPFWQEHMPKASNGKITADVTNVTETGLKGDEVYRLTKLGVADFVTGSAGYASGDVAEIDGMDMTGVAQDTETLAKMIDAYWPVIEDKFRNKAGVEPIGSFPIVGQIFWCAVPISGPKDLAGKKVRVHGAGWAAFVSGLGATTVTMAFGEVVPAMQRKVVDCAVTGATSGNTAKWTEVATHVMPMTIGWSVNITAANPRSWNNLDKPTQAFMRKSVKELMDDPTWELAKESTDHGVWCSTGDSRCKTELSPHLKLDKTDLTLVKLSDADSELRKKVISEHVLPDYTKRCGVECAQKWNETVGKVVGLQAPTN